MSSDDTSGVNESDADLETPPIETTLTHDSALDDSAGDVPPTEAAGAAEAAEQGQLVTASKAPARKPGFGKSLREWGLVVVIAIAAAVLMKLFVVQQFYVSGESMDYTLHNYDRVLVNKLSYDLHDPNRGDVVVLEESQGLSQRDLIKRVIGLPGETIEMRDCVVYINDKVLVEPYLDPKVVTPGNCGPNFAKLTVEKDHVFVMGDNRPGSGDSRGTLGQVDYDQIVGRAFVVIWPKSHWKWL
ncbi:MAG: signal peptidase [Ilumatobacteraceae bacterium]|nr:signal peptidase [Ilumatobacteraceae bacterium]